MFDPRDLEGARRWIDDWHAGIEVRARRTRELSERLALLSGTARSPDGLVAVRLGAGGELIGLELGEGNRGRAPAVIAEEILGAVRVAKEGLLHGVTVAVAQTVGVESATGRAVIASYGCGASGEGAPGG
ncbi:YbaB/EbfC family nucleoid-associated protein [Actinoplanes sp. NPDC051851]|uniref:YbaB/EbfC family nucleoid-associated protein n=1 Tax=Actinoplanes sp. NPDC051851 TaxID=3154753 RepID=UPI003427C4B5